MLTNIERFYEFMQERDRIRRKKESDEAAPWTTDGILGYYKFTNVKREHDRTTKKLCELYYKNPKYKDFDNRLHLLNAALFRWTGTAEFAEAVGYQEDFNPKKIRKIVQERLVTGQKVYTGAYMIPGFGLLGDKIDVILEHVLTPLWKASKEVCGVKDQTNSWKAVLDALRHVYGFGGVQFMGKEVILDTILSPMWEKEPVDFNTWCPVGPGAIRGLNRIYERPLKKSIPHEKLLNELIEIYFQRHYANLDADFPELVLHDIQFQLCEFDKYERVRLGEGKPKAKYKF